MNKYAIVFYISKNNLYPFRLDLRGPRVDSSFFSVSSVDNLALP